jgi:hypothetical protein
MSSDHETPAHTQHFSHNYWVNYPEHGPRESDPYYSDFHAYKKQRRVSGTYHCDFAFEHRGGDTSECDLTKPLECHHRVIEFAVMNAVDLSLLEKDYPGVSSMPVGKWVESAANLELLCVVHHRTHAGKHMLSESDYQGLLYIRNLTDPPQNQGETR